MDSFALYQLVLAAEAPYSRSRAFIEAHGSSPFVDADSVASWPGWSLGEAKRVLSASPRLLAALGHPVQVLTEIEWPDLALAGLVAAFYQGDIGALRQPRVSIVGTRKASAYGKAVARKYGSALAGAGVTVVSGGAYGIDAAAHEGALAAEGRTVAVLANGLDKLYPPAHRDLFFRAARSGGLVSAYAFGSKLEPFKFLSRNVLISALSDAVLLVESPAKSGALSTMKAAREQGRMVFAVAGEPEMESFAGCQLAIESGEAIAVSDPGDILASMGLVGREAAAPGSELAAEIMKCLTVLPQPLERLSELAQIETGILLSELTLLELDGLVVRSAGGYALVP